MVFTEFVIPGTFHIAGLLIGLTVSVLLLYAIRPPLTQRIVIAIVPWMISGSILHVFYQIHQIAAGGLFPPSLAPIFSAPSVYLTTFTLISIIWIMSAMIVPSPDHDRQIAIYMGVIGMGVMLTLFGLLIWQGLGDAFTLTPIFPILGLIISLVLAFVIFMIIGLWRTYIIAHTRYVGFLVIFAHVLDGITTAIGVEILNTSERTFIPKMIMDFAADLPTADTLGEAWLFIVVKIIVASALVILFADYLNEKPAEGNLYFALFIAFGLGPAVNNFMLYLLGI